MDVEEHLVVALAVPDLAAGVAGVGEDRADGVLAPGDAAAVLVAVGVMGGQARDAVAGQRLGDGVDAVPGQEHGEDPLHHRGGGFVNGQGVQPLAVGCLGGVGVRADVDQPVTVGRPAAEEAAFELSLRGHRRSDADLDPVPLAFGDAAEHGHDQVVGLVLGVDGTADLRHPHRHPVMLEQREGVAELIAVERPLRLPHHNGIESSVWVRQCRQQGAGLRPTLGRDRARLVDVEELGDVRPPRGSTRPLARVICQARDDSGSWLSSVDIRPQNASSSSISSGSVIGNPFSRGRLPVRRRQSGP